MIVLSEEVLQDSIFYQMILEKGEERGVRKGVEQGRLEGARTVLYRQLTRRFGNLPDWANTRLNSASSADLDRWSAQIFDALTINEALL